MPKSVSSTLRMCIGPAKGRLLTSMQLALRLVDTAVPIAAAEKQQMIDQLQTLLPKMESQIQTLSEERQQWMQLISDIEEDDERLAEEMLFETTAYSADGFMMVVLEAKETVSLLQSRLVRLEAAGRTSVASASPQSNQVGQAAQQSGSRSQPSVTAKAVVKLPKLELPKFSGDYLDWDQFWRMFSINIHDTTLSNVEKFTYLLGQLTDSASKSIDGICVSDDNYDVAIAALKARYERPPQKLISSYYSQLKRIGRSSVKVADLQKTYDACERIFRLLEKAGESLTNNQSLVLDVYSKYPEQIVEGLFSRRGITSTSTLGEVRTALSDHIREAESLSEIFEELKPFSNVKPVEKVSQPAKSSDWVTPMVKPTSALSSADVAKVPSRARARPDKDSPKSNCYFCNGLHFNAQCENYDTLEARIRRLNTLGRCTKCLSNTHLADGCRTPAHSITCFFCKVSGNHRSPLCPQRFGQAGQPATTLVSADASLQRTSTPEASAQQRGSTQPDSALLNSGESSLLLTALTTIRNPETGQHVSARLLFDTGSHRTYITESCANTLELTSARADMVSVAIFGTKRTLTVESREVNMAITLRDGSSIDMRANTTPIITGSAILPERLPDAAMKWLEAMRDELADNFSINAGKVDILVGTDYFWEFMTGSKITTKFGIHLIPSTLGLLLNGKYKDDVTIQHPAIMLCITETQSPILGLQSTETRRAVPPDVDDFWELERIGIAETGVEDDDSKALNQFNDSIKYVDGRYEVKWPWKPDADKLPTNYQLALGRFRSLAKRLTTTTSDVKDKYHKVIEDQLRSGIIEKVGNEPIKPGHPIHYLPHHPVVRPSSTTTKVRIVYDASSKTRKDLKSLNECLYRGPVMLPDLCAVLIRFRLNDTAIIADIEKAFLQMSLQGDDRDVTRFLWFENPAVGRCEGNIAMYRFCRVPFGVISSPFMLGGTIQHHLKAWSTPVAHQISKDLYVDNVSATLAENDSVEGFYRESKQIFDAAGMNLTQWSSNHPQFHQIVPESDRCKDLDVKVLGIKWSCETDTIRLTEPKSVTISPVSKRGVLKFVASIYDPLGWFQPATLPAKCFLKKLWTQNRDWDEPLPLDLSAEWQTIQNDLHHLFSVKFPRKIGTLGPESALIVFCDASADAYAASVYLRSKSAEGWSVNLLFAKSRLAPKGRGGESVTIPRLELLGLTIAVKAARFVRNALGDDSLRIIIFCDSTCVLSWLKSKKLLPVFVQNRVNQITTLEAAEFRYVKSSDNPADVCTRGVAAEMIGSCAIWWNGPTWLVSDEMLWPQSTEVDVLMGLETTDSDAIAECSAQPVFNTFLAGERLALQRQIGDPLGITASDFSSLNRLLRVTVICLKFIKRLIWQHLSEQCKTTKNISIIHIFENTTCGAAVTAGDMIAAKLLWIQYAQAGGFPDLQACIAAKKRHPLIKQLDTALDHLGTIRCVGRFKHADLPTSALCPILIPRNHVITRLIIKEIHYKLLHSGVSHTLSQVRREYWVPRGRAVVRREIIQCVVCKKYKGSQFTLPRMPPWPRERMARSGPFQFVGLDYLGPINVSLGGETVKMWVCLLTCLAVRAVHLEWVRDCSAQCFVDCLSRFISRRGYPEQIISDNAPQFRVAKTLFDKAWHKAFTDETTCSYLSTTGVNWKYTTELAPWQGGFYERLVGLVKQTFRSEVGRRLLKWDEFITLLTEVEAVVNSRPLTYVYEEFPSGFVLRPCDFLSDQPNGIPSIDRDMPAEGGEAGKNLIRYWKSKQRRLDKLWEYWYDEYLLTLRERGFLHHRTNRSSQSQASPCVGQIVLVKNPNAPRGSWKLGRISQLIASNDSQVRSAELILPNRVTIRRSVTHLYPLEVDPVEDPRDDGGAVDADGDGGVSDNGGDGKVADDGDDDGVPNDSGDGGETDGEPPSLQDVDVEDGFSGFSESEVYGAAQFVGPAFLTTSPSVQAALGRAFMEEGMAASFQRPSQ